MEAPDPAAPDAVAFDFESYPIEPGRQIPKPVCMSYCEFNRRTGVYGAQGVVMARDAAALVLSWMQRGLALVGAETSYDILESIVSAHTADAAENLALAWIFAMDHDDVYDCILRQKLLDIAGDRYRFEEVKTGVWIARNYDLGSLARRHGCPFEVNKKDEWRLRYSELDGVEIAQYPRAAYLYALGDAVATAFVFLAQSRWRDDWKITSRFPNANPLVPEGDEMRAAFPLKRTSAWGLITDADAVASLTLDVAEEIEELKWSLLKTPDFAQYCDQFVVDGACSTPWTLVEEGKDAVVTSYIFARDVAGDVYRRTWGTREELDVAIRTGVVVAPHVFARGRWSRWLEQRYPGVKKEAERDAMAERDPGALVRPYRERHGTAAERDALVAAGLLVAPAPLIRRTLSRTRAGLLGYLRARSLESFCATDRRDAKGDAVWELTRERLVKTRDPLLLRFCEKGSSNENAEFIAAGLVTEEFTRNVSAARDLVAVAYGQDGREYPRTDGKDVSTSNDACVASGSVDLVDYAAYATLDKVQSTDIPLLWSGTQYPIHTRYEVILQTGRTGSSKPNVQNIRRLPGIRECFMPRPGNLFVSIDYGMVELHTLAQTCIWTVGWSRLADALNAGIDPHLQMAALYLGVDYATAAKLKEAGDAVLDNARTMGKGINFGRPGRLSAESFVSYCWAGYKIRITTETALKLIALYDESWPEVPRYFDWVDSFAVPVFRDGKPVMFETKWGKQRQVQEYNITSPYSGFLRGGARGTAACNHPFQHLASRVLKEALWLITKAQMGAYGRDDDLYGTHVVNEVHDEIVFDVEEARAQAVARRGVELMEQASRKILADCPARAEATIADRLSKKAKSTRAKDPITGKPTGPYSVWRLQEAVAKAAAKHSDQPVDIQIAALKKDKWPGFAIARHFGLSRAA